MIARRSTQIGIGWRRELALWIDRARPATFMELAPEQFAGGAKIPIAIEKLRDEGVTLVPHSTTLSLGGAERPDRRMLKEFGRIARALHSPFVSDHIAFVRAGGIDSGHLLPLPRTREALEVMIENVREAQRHLPVPLALENVASLFEWPGAEMTEAEFIAELLKRTGARLLLDVANLHADAVNHGWDAEEFLDTVPLDRLAYVHVAGGFESAGLYHDTHAHDLGGGPLRLLESLCERVTPPAVLLERDDNFPPAGPILRELQAIERAIAKGIGRRSGDAC